MTKTFSIAFFIRGDAVGKGRGRTVRLGNGAVSTYTPAKTRSYEGIVRTMAMDAMDRQQPIEAPVHLELDIVCSVPRSWPEWKRRMALADRIAATSKPDVDNVLKAISDACNGVVWRDDSQIVQIRLNKFYGETPGVQVRVMAFDDLPCQVKKKPPEARTC